MIFFVAYILLCTSSKYGITTCYASEYQLNSKLTLNALVETKMKEVTKCKALASSVAVVVLQCV